jgi:hypothetical protein
VLETSSYHELGRSEVIKHSSNPDFVSAFNVDYAFETCQKLTFEIYNVERRNVNLDKQEVLGTMECNVGEIVSAPAAKLLRPLLIKSKGHVKKHGQIIGRSFLKYMYVESRWLIFVLCLQLQQKKCQKATI